MIETETNAVSDPPHAGGRTKKVRGVVYMNGSRCKGCGFCIAFCPPRVLQFASEFNAQGYHFPELIDPDGCTGCDLCGLYCPDFAIYAVMLKNAPPARAPEKNVSGVDTR
jgi:2-oxoglutarate ferredoxin oxidoreductase subunit delta